MIFPPPIQNINSDTHPKFILGNHERYLLDGRVKSAAKKYYGTFRTTGMSSRELWPENSELGMWLRSKPVMLKTRLSQLIRHPS